MLHASNDYYPSRNDHHLLLLFSILIANYFFSFLGYGKLWREREAEAERERERQTDRDGDSKRHSEARHIRADRL
jgi:hypothetical protein